MITAEKKLLDRNEKIHKLFRQLSGQRDDYENKLQDLQQVCVCVRERERERESE